MNPPFCPSWTFRGNEQGGESVTDSLQRIRTNIRMCQEYWIRPLSSLWLQRTKCNSPDWLFLQLPGRVQRKMMIHVISFLSAVSSENLGLSGMQFFCSRDEKFGPPWNSLFHIYQRSSRSSQSLTEVFLKSKMRGSSRQGTISPYLKIG